MRISTFNNLSHLLLNQQLIGADTLKTAIATAQAQNVPLVSHLVEQGLVSAHAIATAISHATGLPIVDLDAWTQTLPTELIDDKLIAQYRILPLQKQGNTLQIAISDVFNRDAIEAVRFHTQMLIAPVLVEEDKLARRLASLIISDIALEVEDAQEIPEETDDALLDAPTVKFVNKILIDAVKLGASDIHFEPYEKHYRIRYRIDGMMQLANTPPVTSANKLVARLKVMAKLDISERRKPQDGRIKLLLNDKNAVDFRVSTLPTLFGEKVVLRLLDGKQALIGLDALGLTADQKAQFLTALKKPQGMILITGPTGSGKTISLYTALGLLNEPHTNILTAEDPVEIQLDGINQVNINPKVQLDFADALRAFLRQDPDIIMVGEIRDIQTAQIAVKAAQTGHLVLSTLHTNSSAETLVRLHSMGIAAFQLASCISLVIAQRLARRLCDACKRPIHLPKVSLQEMGFSPADIAENPTIYEAVGCHRCRDGYRGRVGVFEVLPITPAISELMLNHCSTQKLSEQALKEGNLNLRQAAILKVKQGIISLQEMHRITCE